MNKMGDMLSQAEIDALLNGTSLDLPTDSVGSSENLSAQEIDALGEIGNISMGTSATTLFTLLGQKVVITTPKVTLSNWDEIAEQFSRNYVAVRVEYTQGLIGSNLLIMKEQDVKIITDLMMGGDGNNTSEPLSDLHLSAISEAMNQMVGSSSTSMSAMFDKRIDISPPKAFILDLESLQQNSGITGSEQLVKIAFKMIIGTLIDSEIMQVLPISFAKKLVDNLLNLDTGSGTYEIPSTPKKAPEPPKQTMTPPPAPQPPQPQYAPPQPAPQHMPPQNYQPDYGYEQPAVWSHNEPRQPREPVNVQPAHFQSFDESRIVLEKKNISLIMDVPLQVTVELGRTQKLIKDILEFGPGSIIELDKLAGEPVDILVNGKAIAKGEVVVIDESFGVRITDIIHPSKRL
jgi:flagellar motor switch protein FliN/FliY